mgnify:CR=1 FL=1
MTNAELNGKVEELRQLKEIFDKLSNVIENLKDEIKSEMTRRDVDTLNGLDWKIIWKEHTSTRLDAEKLKKDFGDLSNYKKIIKYKSFYLKNI